ncbi:MAG: hypothetical protein AB7L71_16430 [Vicinamibacterales bacterium]
MTLLKCVSIVLVAAVVVSTSASPADAQTRAAALAALRDAKAAEPKPTPPSGLEGFLLNAAETRLPARLFNPRSGPFVTVGLPGEGAGFGIGPAWRLQTADRRWTVDGTLAASVSRDWSARVQVHTPDLLPTLGHNRVSLAVGAGRVRRAEDHFWGLGPSSDRAAIYALDRTDAAATLTAHLSPGLHVGASVGVDTTSPAAGRGSGPQLSQRFDGRTAPGLDRSPTYGSVSLSVDFDQRDTSPSTRTGRYFAPQSLAGASSGRRLRVDWSTHRSAEAGDYSQVVIDAQQYLPWLGGHRLLALRALAHFTLADADAVVPFYRLPSAGGTRVGRADPTFRWRDRHLFAAQVEYRYTVNPFMHGAVFVDAVQVASSIDTLRWVDTRWTAGVGLRIGARGGAGLRLDLARGRDGVRLLLGLGHAF